MTATQKKAKIAELNKEIVDAEKQKIGPNADTYNSLREKKVTDPAR